MHVRVAANCLCARSLVRILAAQSAKTKVSENILQGARRIGAEL
jgi:hypothetical protein